MHDSKSRLHKTYDVSVSSLNGYVWPIYDASSVTEIGIYLQISLYNDKLLAFCGYNEMKC